MSRPETRARRRYSRYSVTNVFIAACCLVYVVTVFQSGNIASPLEGSSAFGLGTSNLGLELIFNAASVTMLGEWWRILTAARALDAGVFIAAADQARPDYETKAGEPSGPTGAGHSVVVDPFGTRLAEAGYGPETLVVEIDPADADEARKQLPLEAIRQHSAMR